MFCGGKTMFQIVKFVRIGNEFICNDDKRSLSMNRSFDCNPKSYLQWLWNRYEWSDVKVLRNTTLGGIYWIYMKIQWFMLISVYIYIYIYIYMLIKDLWSDFLENWRRGRAGKHKNVLIKYIYIYIIYIYIYIYILLKGF